MRKESIVRFWNNDNGNATSRREETGPSRWRRRPGCSQHLAGASVVRDELVVVLLQLRFDLGLSVGEGLVEILPFGSCGKGVLRHFDDDFHFFAVLGLVEDDLAIDDASEGEGQNLRPARSSYKAPELGADSGFCVLAQWDGGAL